VRLKSAYKLARAGFFNPCPMKQLRLRVYIREIQYVLFTRKLNMAHIISSGVPTKLYDGKILFFAARDRRSHYAV
jgi:hypothetical protein